MMSACYDPISLLNDEPVYEETRNPAQSDASKYKQMSSVLIVDQERIHWKLKQTGFYLGD